MTKIIFLVVIATFILEQIVLIIRFSKPHGLMHIDEYTDKDAYRMIYFIPLEDIKKHRRLHLKVEVQKWSNESEVYEELWSITWSYYSYMARGIRNYMWSLHSSLCVWDYLKIRTKYKAYNRKVA